MRRHGHPGWPRAEGISCFSIARCFSGLASSSDRSANSPINRCEGSNDRSARCRLMRLLANNTGSSEHEQRKGELSRHQRFGADPGPARRALPRVGSERRLKFKPRRQDRWGKSEEQDRDGGNGQRAGESHWIQMDFAEPRHVWWGERDEEPNGPGRNGNPERAAGDRQQGVLREQAAGRFVCASRRAPIEQQPPACAPHRVRARRLATLMHVIRRSRPAAAAKAKSAGRTSPITSRGHERRDAMQLAAARIGASARCRYVVSSFAAFAGRGAGAKSSDDVEGHQGQRIGGHGRDDRRPEVRAFGIVQPLGHHANDGVWRAVSIRHDPSADVLLGRR